MSLLSRLQPVLAEQDTLKRGQQTPKIRSDVNSKANCAFTLIEILIAVTIFAIVLAAINTVFYSALRLTQKTARAIDAQRALDSALPILQRDLANIVPPDGAMAGPLQSMVLSNALPGQVSPNFYTSDGIVDDAFPWGNLQQVSYLLAQPTNHLSPGLDLIRAVNRNLLSPNVPAPEERPLLSGVQSVTFLYFDGFQWESAWDSTAQTNLPLAIKVQIQMTPPLDGAAATFPAPIELVVPLDARVPVTNQTQQTSGGGS